MTHDEMIAVIQAHKEGKKIQGMTLSGFGSEWCNLDDPIWNFRDVEYRIKPEEPKKVKLLAWYTGQVLHWCNEEARMSNAGWIRIPSEDKVIEIPVEGAE